MARRKNLNTPAGIAAKRAIKSAVEMVRNDCTLRHNEGDHRHVRHELNEASRGLIELLKNFGADNLLNRSQYSHISTLVCGLVEIEKEDEHSQETNDIPEHLTDTLFCSLALLAQLHIGTKRATENKITEKLGELSKSILEDQESVAKGLDSQKLGKIFSDAEKYFDKRIQRTFGM